ncbi:MAG: hypothetical protein K8T10_01365 [Candidatus Eremiobacteraeota bacterium]|nr:hypothetical protein [Candidatus Eremiobacteraeota bacterium]
MIGIILFELRRDAVATDFVIMVGVASRRPNNKKLFSRLAQKLRKEVVIASEAKQSLRNVEKC